MSMDSGSWIRKLREERFLRAREVERLSRAIVEATGNPGFYVSHASLADIEAGAVPSIHKLFSLACFLGISYDDLLRAFGVNQRDIVHFAAPIDPDKTALVPAGRREGLPFSFNVTSQSIREETDLLQSNPEEWAALPLGFFRLDPRRYRYALVGSKDDTMGELIPPGSLVEVDTQQNIVQMSTWRGIRERPIYLVWHANGYSCGWCQQERGELMLVPHPSSEQPVRHFKTPRDATIVGRIVAAWMSFAQPESSEGPMSLPM
jgi:transcriptional regulator with XRE-family HTH domain